MEAQSEEARYENGKIRTVLPYLQDAIKNDFSLKSNLSIGVCESDPETPDRFSLELRNVCAIVRLALPGSVSVSRVELKSNGGEPLSGNIEITPGDEPSFTVLDGKDYVELVGSGMKSATYFIPVLPCTLEKGFCIKLYCEGLDRPFAEITSNKSVTLKRSVILNLGTLNCTSDGGFAGSGTDEDPFIITSLTQLQRMQSLINEGKDLGQSDSWKSSETKYKKASYYLACDIDCKHNNVGIGWDLESGCIRFQGHFDGGGDTSDALGAISGQSETFHSRADCTECYFTNDPNMYSTGDGSCHHCWYYGAFSELAGKPLSGNFLNSRKLLVNSHSSDGAKIWTNAQWAASADWTGEAVNGGPCTLDIPEAGYSQSSVL